MKRLARQPAEGLSLSRYTACTHRGRLGKNRKREVPRDRQKTADERRESQRERERDREICFLFTESRGDEKQSCRLLDHNGHSMDDNTHTFTRHLPLSSSSDYTAQI